MESKLWILSAFIVGIVVGALGVGLGVALGVGLTSDFKRCNEVSNISLGTTTLSTSTTSTTSPAPAGYIYSNQTFGTFYYKFYEQKTWYDAKRACEKDGAELPVPRSDEENEYFSTLATESIWLGINDVENEGVWVDNDGKRISYQNWGYGEPNNVDGGEDAVSIGRWDDSSKWNDARIASQSIYTLCIFYP